VEDAAGAVDRRPDGSRVEEIHLEQPEARVRAVQGQQVLRLALIIEVLHGGVDGIGACSRGRGGGGRATSR